MDIVTLPEAQADLVSLLDRVVADHAPIAIARESGRSVVLVSLEDWSAMDETAYLLSSPRNAERLRHAIAQAEAGRLVERDVDSL